MFSIKQFQHSWWEFKRRGWGTGIKSNRLHSMDKLYKLLLNPIINTDRDEPASPSTCLHCSPGWVFKSTLSCKGVFFFLTDVRWRKGKEALSKPILAYCVKSAFSLWGPTPVSLYCLLTAHRTVFLPPCVSGRNVFTASFCLFPVKVFQLEGRRKCQWLIII